MSPIFQRRHSDRLVDESAGWLGLLCLGRFGTTLMFMAYAAALPELIDAWGMTSTQAGTVAGVLNLSFGAAVVAASWLAGRIGARRLYLAAVWSAAVAAIAFALLAGSYESALVLVIGVGLASGAAYGPALMLVAEHVPTARRGSAMGWLLAAASLGYAGSLLLAAVLIGVADYRVGFLATAAGPVAGALVASIGLARTPNLVHRAERGTAGSGASGPDARRRPSRAVALLTAGYVGHSWELLGMWAWMPAFLVAATGSGLGVGLALGVVLHLAGFVASASMGTASDRIGRRRVLIGMGSAGAACSLIAGWLFGAPPILLLVLVVAYGFAAIGDSSVLSTSMTESVTPGRLGSALAVRSLLGFAAGAIAPIAFGVMLGTAADGAGWGWAFAVLGIGGVLATACAVLLPDGP